MRTGRISITVDVSALNAEAARVGRVEVTDMCRKIKNQAIVNCPVDMGFMRGQHFMRVGDEATRIVGEVENQAEYAGAVHNGSKARIIRPRKGKFLRFEVGGRVVFARSVRHPGTKGRPWLRSAAETVAQGNGWTFSSEGD
jgi:hypothetical protein